VGISPGNSPTGNCSFALSGRKISVFYLVLKKIVLEGIRFPYRSNPAFADNENEEGKKRGAGNAGPSEEQLFTAC
jgi:hypothetical protein